MFQIFGNLDIELKSVSFFILQNISLQVWSQRQSENHPFSWRVGFQVVSQNVVFFCRSCNQDALELDCLGFKSNRVIRISSNFRASKAKGKSHIDWRIRDYHYLLLEMLSSSLNLWKASSYCIVLGTQEAKML